MLPQKEPTVQSEAEKKAAYETYKLQARAYQAVYDNFRYTDAQREQTIDFIAAAMKVIRGEAEFDSLKLLLPVVRTGMALNLALALVVVLVEALPQGAESAEAAAAKFLPPAPPQQQDDGNPPG